MNIISKKCGARSKKCILYKLSSGCLCASYYSLGKFMTISETDRQKLKELLLTTLKQANKDLESLGTQLKDTMETFVDPLDKATAIEARNNLEPLIRNKNAQIRSLNYSLENFKDYGYCEDCGIDINILRLMNNPTAIRCIDCQEFHESKSRNIR